MEGKEETEEEKISLFQLTENTGAMKEGVTIAQPSKISIPPPEKLLHSLLSEASDEKLKENILKLIGD